MAHLHEEAGETCAEIDEQIGIEIGYTFSVARLIDEKPLWDYEIVKWAHKYHDELGDDDVDAILCGLENYGIIELFDHKKRGFGTETFWRISE